MTKLHILQNRKHIKQVLINKLKIVLLNKPGITKYFVFSWPYANIFFLSLGIEKSVLEKLRMRKNYKDLEPEPRTKRCSPRTLDP